jgi:hypothetical protein
MNQGIYLSDIRNCIFHVKHKEIEIVKISFYQNVVFIHNGILFSQKKKNEILSFTSE